MHRTGDADEELILDTFEVIEGSDSTNKVSLLAQQDFFLFLFHVFLISSLHSLRNWKSSECILTHDDVCLS